jgi:hypothetical protein
MQAGIGRGRFRVSLGRFLVSERLSLICCSAPTHGGLIRQDYRTSGEDNVLPAGLCRVLSAAGCR